MRNVFLLIATLLCLGFANVAQAEDSDFEELISLDEVRKLKKKIAKRFTGNRIEMRYARKAIGKVSYYHVNDLLARWRNLPEEVKEKVVFQFESAGLAEFTYLCVWESGINPLDDTRPAYGLYQITLRTAKHHCGIELKEELLDPVVNATCAVEILLEKRAKKGYVVGLINYHGRLKKCRSKSGRKYMYCVEAQLIIETDEKKEAVYMRALTYVGNAFVHQAIGEELFAKK
ncbi:hypothetical protein HQ571_03975 [Candidatus Kuenenbacteria bacterium]|nr:hypothetical protein [Candidatus Kuenenbacteria bacterium]